MNSFKPRCKVKDRQTEKYSAMCFESNVFTPRTYELEWPIPSFDAFRAECLKKLDHVANSVCTISYPNAEGRTETITTDSDVRTLAHLVGHAAKAPPCSAL